MQPPPLKPRISRFNRILLIVMALVVVGLPLSHFLWGVWAAHRLNQVLEALRAAGEPMQADQLRLDSLPDAQNASLDYLAAANSINDRTPQWKLVDLALCKEFEPPLTDSEKGTIHAIVSQDASALSLAAAARGKRAGGWKDLPASTASLSLRYVESTRRLCQLLCFAAMDAHAGGDDQKSVDFLGDALAEADAAEQRPTLIGHLVAIGCTAKASDEIGRMAADLRIGANGLSRTQITSLIATLQNEGPMNEGEKLCWRSERLFGLRAFQGVSTGIWSWTGSGATTPSASPTDLAKLGYLVKPIELTDARLYLEYMQQVMIAGTAPDWPTARRQMPTQLPAMVDAHPIYHLLLRIILPPYDKAAQADYGAKAHRRLATVALAVRLYAADHDGQLPRKLDDLVPAYLPAIPIDPFSGSPLKYKADPPRIYSVGVDGVDDGGIPTDPDGNSYHQEHGDSVIYLVTQPRK